MTLSEIVKNYREENGISQREFAKRCELSNSLISIIERGVNPQTGNPVDPDSRTLRRLAAGMGMTELRLLELLKSNNQPPAFASDLNEYDRDALEALHQDPKLRMLFDRARTMSEADKNRMVQISGIMKGELYGDE